MAGILPKKAQFACNVLCEFCPLVSFKDHGGLNVHKRTHSHKVAEAKAKGLPPPPPPSQDPDRPFSCETCPDSRFPNTFDLNRHYGTKKHLDNANGIVPAPIPLREKVAHPFMCLSCPNTSFPTKRLLASHYRTKMHAANVAKEEANGIFRSPSPVKKKVPGAFVCGTCPGTTFNTKGNLDAHYTTKTHIANVAKDEAEGIFRPPPPPRKVWPHPFKCATCPDSGFTKKMSLLKHYTTSKHKANLAAAEVAVTTN